MYATKNYITPGGEKLVIGGEIIINGKLTIDDDATLAGLPAAENQAASTASAVSGLKDDFNALLEKLKAAGLMEADAAEDASGDA